MNKKGYDIIFELAKKADENADLSNPDIQNLIYQLSIAAQVIDGNDSLGRGYYYSVKEVAELFDVTKQTVYKWIDEDKIDYEEDKSPGKIQRKGYRIPKKQFQTEVKIKEVDPSFFSRRDEETREIPNTGLSQNIILPNDEEKPLKYDDIKQNILGKKDGTK